MSLRRLEVRARRAGIGALPMLAGLVLASALLRLGDGTAGSLLHRLSVATTAHASADPAAEGDEVATILTALAERQAALESREAELDARAEGLDAAQRKLTAKIEEIEAAEEELRQLLKLADSAAQDDLARLATVYENMKPAEAGPLFNEMPPAFAAGFLGLMDPAATAAILARLPPDAAYAISVMLAGRHAALPRE